MNILRTIAFVLPVVLCSCNLPKAPLPVFTSNINALAASCKSELQAEGLSYKVSTSLVGKTPLTTITCEVLNCQKLPATSTELGTTAFSIAYYFYHSLQNKQKYDQVAVVFATEKKILVTLYSNTTFTYNTSALETAITEQEPTAADTINAQSIEETEASDAEPLPLPATTATTLQHQ